MIHECIADQWFLTKMIGKGTFSELFAGVGLRDSSIVAVKIHETGKESTVLRNEANVMKALSGLATAPRFIHADCHAGKYDYIVMELLSGGDMSDLRNRTRNHLHFIPLPVVIHLSFQMIQCLQDMHRRGYIHRDVKPANFVRRSSELTSFCLIDFGISKQVSSSCALRVPTNDRSMDLTYLIRLVPF